MRAHEEAEWTGLGVNPELISTLGDMAEAIVKAICCVPLEYRPDILRCFLASIREGVEGGGIGTKH